MQIQEDTFTRKRPKGRGTFPIQDQMNNSQSDSYLNAKPFNDQRPIGPKA